MDPVQPYTYVLEKQNSLLASFFKISKSKDPVQQAAAQMWIVFSSLPSEYLPLASKIVNNICIKTNIRDIKRGLGRPKIPPSSSVVAYATREIEVVQEKPPSRSVTCSRREVEVAPKNMMLIISNISAREGGASE